MGDESLEPGAPAEFPGHVTLAGAFPEPVHVESGYITTAPQPAIPSQQQHDETAEPQRAFASQLDMTYQPHQQSRMGSYDFSAMANALPPQPYRPQGYGQNPQRYNTATASMMSPGTAAQIPAAQYGAGTAGMGPVQAQQYYLPHHMHMATFYSTPLPPQPPTGLPPRPELGYYQSPVVMSQPPHPAAQFYYTPAPPFPGQVPHVQGQFPPGQYGMPTPQQYPDARSRQLQNGNRETNSVSHASQENSRYLRPRLQKTPY